MTAVVELKSSDGRAFAIRDVTPAEMLDLIEAAGPAAASQAWMRYALMICSVSAIDSKPLIMPSTKDGIRELGRKIGNAGMEVLADYHYPDDVADSSSTEEMDRAKN